jgi:flagellar hook-associated protein 2
MAVDNNLITALGAGSGVDIKALAQGLTDAEKVPKQNAIQSKIDKSEAKISGYSAMMAGLNIFKKALEGIDSTTDFASTSVRSSNSTAFTVASTSLASPGSHSVSVNTLASAQRSNSDNGFDNITAQINGGNAFTMTITVGTTPTTISIDAASTNLSAVASAITASAAGVTAQVLDTGSDNDDTDRYRLVLSGPLGADNAFTVSTTLADPTELAFTTPAGQTASDASLTINGITVSRTTNTIDDVITGVTFDLQTTTSSAATVVVSRDGTGLKTKIESIVEAYNDLVSDFAILTGPKSDDEEDVFSGSLRGDSAPRGVLAQIREVLFGSSDIQTDTVNSFRDLGVTVDKSGVLTLDSATLEAAISNDFDDVVSALASRVSTTDSNGDTVITRGLGVELLATVNTLMGTSGAIYNQSSSAESQVARYKEQLETLEERMEVIKARYLRQFAAMESIVGQISATREGLKGQFEALSNAYNQ